MIVTLLAVYTIILAVMVMYQRKLMYFPHINLRPPVSFGLTDVKAGKLMTPDQEMLDYWYTSAKEGMPTILYFHGNGGHLGYRADFIHAAQRHGYGVWMLSYRGYGNSTGSPSEAGFYTDANAAYEYVVHELGIPRDQVIIYGESIGSAVAVELAQHKKVKALVLQAPFSSAVAVAQRVYFWLPVSLLMKDRFESIKKVKNINAPVLVFGAENDRVTGLDEAKKLYDAFAQPKKIIVFENTGHNDFNVEKIFQHLGNFNNH